jgi:hypothetical protein
MTRYHVIIPSPNRDMMLDLVRKLKIQVFDHGVKKTAEEGYNVDALVEDQDIKTLETKGYRVRRNHDADESGKKRQQEVGRQNRYSETEFKTNRPASEIGGGSYLNIDEVESALEQSASTPNNDFTQLITLPNQPGKEDSVMLLRWAKGPSLIVLEYIF